MFQVTGNTADAASRVAGRNVAYGNGNGSRERERERAREPSQSYSDTRALVAEERER